MLCLVRLKLEDHLLQGMTLIHINHTEETLPYVKPCSCYLRIQILNNHFLYDNLLSFSSEVLTNIKGVS